MTEEILTQLPEVAKNVFLQCKKCGVERFHKVLFHVNANSAKVECEVCKSKKTFKIGAPKKASTTPRKAPAKRATAAVNSGAVWSELKDKIGTDKVSNYSMVTKYEPNTAVEHPKFGLGFIVNVTYNRVEVQFQDSVKTLVHNNTVS